MEKKKTKVLVALSGGVDSSIAAYLMNKEGHEVICAFMKNWSDTKNDMGECSWREDRRMARRVTAKLNLPLITLDFEKEYRKSVVEEMFKQYKEGITPNPDVDCNQLVKFPLLWKAAKKLGCQYIVTGHYARIKKKKNKYYLLRGKEDLKDQSYFLYRLSQEDLSHTLFPIGEYTKKEIRNIAKKLELPNHDRESTKGICFIGKVNLKEFLKKKIKQKKGKILSPEGKIIGEHDGVFYYTIGQRIGPRFGIDINPGVRDRINSQRWYVAKKDVKKNIIVAAPKGHPILLKKYFTIKNLHLITEDIKETKKKKMTVDVRIRKVGELLPAKMKYETKKKSFTITLKEGATGISQGQASVIYKPKSYEVIGGGIVSS